MCKGFCIIDGCEGKRVRKLVKPIRICLGSWNVGSLIGKLREVAKTTIRRRVNILCVPETKWKG